MSLSDDRSDAAAGAPSGDVEGPLGGAAGSTAAMLAVAVAAVSTAAILVRVARAPALALAFWRNAGGALILAPFAVRARFRPGGRDLAALLAAGCALAVHFALFIGSLSLTTVASSVVLVSSSPVVVGMISAARATDAPSRRAWAGISIGTVGAVVVTLADHAGSTAPSPLLGDVMAFGGAVTFAVYLVFGRALRSRLPVAVYAGWVYGVAAVLLGAACLLTGTTLGLGGEGWPASTWWAVAGLVAGPQLLGHTIFNTVLARVPPSVVALTTLAEPVASAVLAAVLLAELPSAGFLLGAPLVLWGVWLGTTRSRRPPVAPTSRLSATPAPGGARTTQGAEVTAEVGSATGRGARGAAPVDPGGEIEPRDLWTDSRMTTLRIAAYEPPSDDGGTPSVVVLTGLGASVDALRGAVPRFDPFIALAATGVRVYAVDWPGHGRSGGPRGHLTYRLAMEAAADVVDLVLARGDGPVTLFGLGIGGSLACYAALEDERVAAVVSQGLADLRDVRPLLQRLRQQAALPVAGRAHRLLDPRLARRIRVPLSILTAPGDRAFDPDLARRLTGHPQWVQTTDLAALASLLLTPEEKPSLAALRTPTLVVVGARDHVLPVTAAHAAAAQLAGPHRVWVLPAAGHQLLLEHHRALLPELRGFLDEVLRPRA